MADAPAAAGQTTPAAPPKKKKGKGLLIVLIVVLVLAAGGGGAAFYFWKASAAPASDASHKEAVKVEAADGVVALEPFLVNLADEGSHAYLRVSLKLLVTDEEQVKLFEEKAVIQSMVRSAILETLATQTAENLVTPEGKAALKETITKKIAALKQPIHVHDVLFSDFVVQY